MNMSVISFKCMMPCMRYIIAPTVNAISTAQKADTDPLPFMIFPSPVTRSRIGRDTTMATIGTSIFL